jgi:hypothetical protein
VFRFAAESGNKIRAFRVDGAVAELIQARKRSLMTRDHLLREYGRVSSIPC